MLAKTERIVRRVWKCMMMLGRRCILVLSMQKDGAMLYFVLFSPGEIGVYNYVNCSSIRLPTSATLCSFCIALEALHASISTRLSFTGASRSVISGNPS